MNVLELTVDGTNFGGKTPLVNLLVAKLRHIYTVECCNPFKEQPYDLYSRWGEAPIEAAQLVAAHMHQRRETGSAEVLIWDRGWPTVHMATRCVEARALVPPISSTFILLNTVATTAAKVVKYGLTPATHPWMHGERLPDETTYDDLTKEFENHVTVFRPDLNGVFDLELVSDQILCALTRR